MKKDACRTCGAPILWAVTRKGKRMPLDFAPVEAGPWIVEMAPNGEVTSVWIGGAPRAGLRYTSHFGTCPQAAEHSGRPRSAAPAKASCRSDAEGFCATHPPCEMTRILVEALRKAVK